MAGVLIPVQDIADELDLWRKNGVDLKPVVIAGIGSLNAVIAGSADFAVSSGSTLIRAAARGQRLLAIATTEERLFDQLVVRRAVAMEAGFDPTASLAVRARVLKDRTIAVDGMGAIGHAFVRLVALRGGLDPDANVRMTPTPPASMQAAFDSNAVDGFVAGVPLSVRPIEAGTGVVIASAPDGDPADMVPFAAAIVVTRPEVCQQHRPLCVAVGGALSQSADYIAAHPNEAAAMLRKKFPAVSDSIFAASWVVQQRITPRRPAVTAIQIEHSDLYNIAAGLAKPEEKRASYDDLFTDEFIK